MSAKHVIISDCPACGDPMDITAMPPFTRVSCASCGEKTRVKCDFGPYHLERRLAIGGMSVVFVARDTLLDREVAVKILNEDYSANERRISAFEEEARVTASLSHPNIVRVLTTGRAYERFFIAMELVPGGHFEHHIHTEGKIPETRMIRLAIQIANGLKAAHTAKLIHRDIKPGNILLDADGNAKIVDFGLALVTQGGTARANEFWATPYYVPPETIDGKAEDFRSDIYAFGATLYHALSGKPPCNEQSMATDVLRAAKKNVVPLHKIEPTLSLTICEIVTKAMAYEPGDRYNSYDELIHELEAAANQTKHGITRISAGEAANRRVQARRAKRLAWSSAAMFAAIALISAIAWLVSGGDTHDNKGTTETPPDSAPPPADNATAATTLDVVVLLREASDAMTSRAFGDASSQFEFLLIHPQVREPTRTWAGAQATAAAFFDGNASRARNLARTTIEHAADAEIDDPGLTDIVLPVMRQLTTRAPIPYQSTATEFTDAPTLIARMLAALHNWQHAPPGEASLFLHDIIETPLDEDAQWVAHYQEFARDCQRDIELLSDPVFEQQPADLAATNIALDRLNVIQSALATQGRAIQIIRHRRRELEHLRDEFTIEPDHGETQDTFPVEDPPEIDTPEDTETHQEFDDPFDIPAPPPLERIADQLANYQFAQARRTMRTLTDEDVPQRGRNVWMTLTRSAQSFIRDVQGDLAGNALPITEIQLKSGETHADIRPNAASEFLETADGQIIPWTDIHADSFIEWHRARVRRIEDSAERMLAHESAISFDLLVGDRSRATTAIQRLGEDDTNFERYWRYILDHLPN